MIRLIYSLIIIIGSLVAGRVVYTVSMHFDMDRRDKINRLVDLMRNIAFFGLVPFTTINAFWIVDLSSISIIAVPILGVGALFFGSVVALLMSKILRHSKQKTGAMLCCGSSTNLGTIGALVCFTLLGEAGFAFNALYKFFEQPYVYLVMYPAAKTFSHDHSANKRWLIKLIKDPIIRVYFSSIIIGLILNLFKIERPAAIEHINAGFIPLSSFLLITAIGYSMRFSKIKHYKKEIVGISLLKYILTPLVIITLSLLLRLDRIGDGTLFRTIIVMSALPTGFNSIIPTQLYKLDINLANSCWIVTTSLLVIVIPIITFLIK